MTIFILQIASSLPFDYTQGKLNMLRAGGASIVNWLISEWLIGIDGPRPQVSGLNIWIPYQFKLRSSE